MELAGRVSESLPSSALRAIVLEIVAPFRETGGAIPADTASLAAEVAVHAEEKLLRRTVDELLASIPATAAKDKVVALLGNLGPENLKARIIKVPALSLNFSCKVCTKRARLWRLVLVPPAARRISQTTAKPSTPSLNSHAFLVPGRSRRGLAPAPPGFAHLTRCAPRRRRRAARWCLVRPVRLKLGPSAKRIRGPANSVGCWERCDRQRRG